MTAAPELPAEAPDHHALVRDHTVYACVMGSRAFGLATEASDTDRRGVYLAPTPLFWRFEKPPTHVEGPREEEFSWELERVCELALRANPNILEVLHSPLVETLTPVGEELLSLREAFLSRRAHATFTRYAASQHAKLRADVRTHGAPRWKHAMHLVRLLLSCRDLLRTGRLAIDATPHRDRLLALKRGELTWPEVESWVTRLAEESEAALTTTPLPESPDHARVESFLTHTRRASAVRWAVADDEVVQRGMRGGPVGEG
ncbi:nucleotidyltransferase domain-containing protein [Streptomyces sp. BR123]|uniref:nucleotidyltransferase domain-containing protein n=1 Tax=Streptomyces sp. BR123 TaxID=2749828 RepID=UPI0015C4621C|nr:nucleotidyltransferase domain-containing protein [Streptomyces sp. BR123]NXY97287.1 nucleotidyltransferase domain-containing protein [Streptomyces sp. BR123]